MVGSLPCLLICLLFFFNSRQLRGILNTLYQAHIFIKHGDLTMPLSYFPFQTGSDIRYLTLPTNEVQPDAVNVGVPSAPTTTIKSMYPLLDK